MDDKYEDLKNAFNSGQLVYASRRELERYAVMVCHPTFEIHFPGLQGPQISEMVRVMLLVRISEDTQTQALTVARTALILAVVAAMSSCLQVLAEMGAIPTLKSIRASLSQPASQAPAQQSRAPSVTPSEPPRHHP